MKKKALTVSLVRGQSRCLARVQAMRDRAVHWAQAAQQSTNQYEASCYAWLAERAARVVAQEQRQACEALDTAAREITEACVATARAAAEGAAVFAQQAAHIQPSLELLGCLYRAESAAWQDWLFYTVEEQAVADVEIPALRAAYDQLSLKRKEVEALLNNLPAVSQVA